MDDSTNEKISLMYTSVYDLLNSFPVDRIEDFTGEALPLIAQEILKIDGWKDSVEIAADVWTMYAHARTKTEKSHDEIYTEIVAKYPNVDPARKKQIYARIVKKAKTHIPAQVPVHAITQERKTQGDALIAEKVQNLLNLSTLEDVLYEYRDTIRDLRGRGHPDQVICKLFMDAYSFVRVTSADLDMALKKRKVI